MKKMIRQGDLLLISIPQPKIEGLAQPAKRKQASQLLIAGERTGHTHRLRCQVFQRHARNIVSTIVYLSLARILTHQEHSHVFVPEGWYEVRQQREYQYGRRWD